MQIWMCAGLELQEFFLEGCEVDGEGAGWWGAEGKRVGEEGVVGLRLGGLGVEGRFGGGRGCGCGCGCGLEAS